MKGLCTLLMLSLTASYSVSLLSTSILQNSTANGVTNTTDITEGVPEKIYNSSIVKETTGVKNVSEKTDNSVADSNKNTNNAYTRFIRADHVRAYGQPQSSTDNLLSGQLKESQCAVNNTCVCFKDETINRLKINCRYKKLDAIPTFIPLDIVYYQISFAQSNYITRLPFDAFVNLKVERIDLFTNHLSAVEPGAFNGLTPYLLELFIEGNGVNGIEIPFPSMSILRNLQILKVRFFRQDRISEVNYFGSFPNLEILELSHISLSYIDRLAFRGKLSHLQHLQFQSVQFTQIPVESLRFLPSLKKLFIQSTNINTVYSQSFEKLTNLMQLDLTYNQIVNMSNNAFIGISNQLTHLFLDANRLTPESLKALSSKAWNNLIHLSFSYNHDLIYMPTDVFQNMPNLQNLFMVDINLKQISSDLFTGLGNLLTLDLGWNNIEMVQDGAFQSLSQLYELKLDNQCDNCKERSMKLLDISPGALHGLEDSLKFLDLKKTALKSDSFWKTLKGLKEIEKLWVSETNLSVIPVFAFSHNQKLITIKLNKNNIQNLNQGTFKGLENSLEELSLNDNNLSTISDCIFKNFNHLNNIHLLRNPLNCDCRLKWLHSFIIEKSQTKNNFICTQPKSYANKPLHEISPMNLVCNEVFPERCIDPIHSTSTKGSITSSGLSSTVGTNSLKLTIVTQSSSSITIAWSVSLTDKSSISGFNVEYKLTTQHEKGHEDKVHRGTFIHTLHNLLHGSFYKICVSAEINRVENESVKDCRTAQTMGKSSGGEGQVDNNNNSDDDGSNRNIIIGAIIATIAVVILIAIGICSVVKYKVQSLKELQLALNYPTYRHQYIDEDGMKVSVVPNVYNEIDVARIANKYKVKCSKNMQRQFGVENDSYESDDFDPYKKLGKRRRNPYENDDEEEPQIELRTEKNEVHYKNELDERHSAPSRLDASSLKYEFERNSRPLPKTPAESDNKKRSSTLKPVKKAKRQDQKQMLVTKASVYSDDKIYDKVNDVN